MADQLDILCVFVALFYLALMFICLCQLLERGGGLVHPPVLNEWGTMKQLSLYISHIVSLI